MLLDTTDDATQSQRAARTTTALVDARELARGARSLQLPFRIRLGAAHGEAVCREVYRLLPGRRIVARGVLGDREVLLKLFLGLGARRYAAREVSGIGAMSRAHVKTPAVLAHGDLECGGGAWVALELIPEARVLTEADLSPRSVLLPCVLRVLARLHESGVAHHDLHLANFLLARGEIHAVDGDAVRVTARARRSPAERALDHSSSLRDVALLLAQLATRSDAELLEAAHAYAAERGWSDPRALDALAPLLVRARNDRVRRYARKTLRDCTEFQCQRSLTRYAVRVRARASRELDALLADPDRFIAGGRALKRGRTATVAEVTVGDETLVVKRYNLKSVGHALRRLLQPSRARRAWQNAHRLRLLGGETPRPRAFLERRAGPFCREAYLVMERIDGCDLLRHVETRGCEEWLVARVAHLFHVLASGQLVHGDTKASNFIVACDGLSTAGRVALIDLDALRYVRSPRRFRAAFAREVTRFLRNFDHLPDARERFRTALATLDSASECA